MSKTFLKSAHFVATVKFDHYFQNIHKLCGTIIIVQFIHTDGRKGLICDLNHKN